MNRTTLKYLIGLTVTLLLTLISSQIILNTFITDINEANEHGSLEHVLETCEQLNFTLQNVLDNTWERIGLVRNSLVYLNLDTETILSYLEYIRQNARVDGLYLLGMDDSLIGSGTTARTPWTSDTRIRTLLHSGNPVIFTGLNSDGEARLVFAQPVTGISIGETVVRSIIAEYRLDGFLEALEMKSYEGNGVFCVVNAEGASIMRTGKINMIQNQSSHFFDNFATAEFLYNDTVASADDLQREFVSGSRGAVAVVDNGKKYALSYTPLKQMDWTLALVIDFDVIQSSRLLYTTRVEKLSSLLMVAVVVICLFFYAVLIFIMNRRTDILLRSKEKLADILISDSMMSYMLLDEKNLVCRYVSPGTHNILGIDPEKFIGQPFDTFALQECRGQVPSLTDTMEHWDKGKSIETERFRYQDPSTGQIKFLKERCLMSAGGEVLVIFMDETADIKQEEALKHAVLAAQAANHAKTTFLSSMSHDIRTPMNAVIGFASLLEHDAENPTKVREYVRKIMFSGKHLLSLINDILDMSKIESGKITLNTAEFKLGGMLEEINVILLPQAAAKKQQFDIKVTNVQQDILVGDVLRIKQILLNLLSNAVKYTGDGGKIQLLIEGIASNSPHYIHLRFRVSDTGIGMTPEFMKTVFEPFSREAADIQGTGLGMAIVKNLVDLMGGTVSVESELGKGSLFTVDLEFRIPENELDLDFWKKHGIHTILIVDDEPDFCLNIQNLMADAGVSVVCAYDGVSAVEAVCDAHQQGELFDLILLDWKMPGMNGAETAEAIRSKTGLHIPMLILSAYDWDEIQDEARAAGIEYFMSKPFFLSNFQQAVLNLTAGRELPPQVPAARSVAGMKFLVAEDNALNSEIISELLKMEQAECVVVENGRECVKTFEAFAPGTFDVILMDIQMPVMNGYDAARAVRNSTHPDSRKIIIIAMTANAFDEDIQNALASGMNAHLSKPVDITVLKTTVLDLTV